MNLFTVDCIVSEWKASACPATCGAGHFKILTRTILQHPRNGGRACPAPWDSIKTEPCHLPECASKNLPCDINPNV